jgi:GxxExxY protein
MDSHLLYSNETYLIQGAIFEVNKIVGCGFLESVYQECLEHELTLRDIPFISHPQLELTYKGKKLSQTFVPDIICFDKIVVELKAVKTLLPEHESQVLNYLKASELKIGLLVNFGSFPKTEVKRLIF